MKTEFIDVSDTQKNLVVEIPSTVVDAEIDKVARDYSRAARSRRLDKASSTVESSTAVLFGCRVMLA